MKVYASSSSYTGEGGGGEKKCHTKNLYQLFLAITVNKYLKFQNNWLKIIITTYIHMKFYFMLTCQKNQKFQITSKVFKIEF